EELQKKESEINEKFNTCSEPSIIYEGMNKYFVLFDMEDKEGLDSIRKKAMPTIMNHHKLKSAGYTILTDFAENLLDKFSDDEINSKINEVLLRYGPTKEKMYRIAFTRLNGTSFKIKAFSYIIQFCLAFIRMYSSAHFCESVFYYYYILSEYP
ncbi:MAG: hypothetical protein BJBARM5_0688, partial [Candidatus Parvarchaeum acidophilus ARMAN-5]